MGFDSNVPADLKDVQCWFGSIIARPIDRNSCMMPISPSGVPMSQEAAQYITPSPTLKPEQRIQIYNQQYWWRLLTIMQDNFPFVVRLFGYTKFNESIAEPYIKKYPPSHWSLNILGERLNHWIEEDYDEDDRRLLSDAVTLDYAYLRCFLAGENSVLNLLEGALDEGLILHLQPHVFLLKFDYDLITLRKEMMQENPDYWMDHDFPEMEKGKHHYVMYRNKALNVSVETINGLEFEVLKLFQKGMSIDGFCEWMEAQDVTKAEQAEAELQQWFQKWSAKGLLCKE